MSLYDRLRRGLRRTATHLAGRVDEVSAQSPDGAPDISTILHHFSLARKYLPK